MPIRFVLSLILSLLGASTAFAQTTVTPPALPQPSATGDLVAVRILNSSGGTWTGAKWVRFGQVFKDADVPAAQLLAARACTNAGCTTGSTVYIGVDPQSTHPTDSSILIADIVASTQGTLTNGSSQDLMILKCGGGGQPACPSAPITPPPSAATVAALSDLATPVFATNGSGGFNETDHCTGNGGSNILAAANTGGTTVTRYSNGAMKEYIARGTANSGKLNVTCVIDAYQDGTTITDVILGNDWYQTASKADQVYDFSMTVPAGATGVSYHSATGSCSNSFVTGNTHALYTRWHCKVYGNGQIQPTIQYDVPYFEATKVILPYDTTYGVAYSTPSNPTGGIQDIAGCLSAGTTCPQPGRASSALGTTIFDPAWAGGGGNFGQIAQEPFAMLEWALSQDPTAFKNMLILSEATGSIPWHMRQETTNAPLDPTVNTLQWDCDHGMSAPDLPTNGCPNFASTPPTPSSSGIYWGSMAASGDGTNHAYDQNFLTYLTTLDYFQQQLFEYQVQAEALGVYNRLGSYFGSTQLQCAEHNFLAVRGQAWCLRAMIRCALWCPDSDGTQTSNPKTIDRAVLASSLTSQTMFWEYSGAGLAFGLGQLEGHVLNPNGAYGVGSIFMNNYLLTSLYTLASMNYSPYSGQATALLGYHLPTVSGLVTSGNLGFPTNAGSVFEFYSCENATNVGTETCFPTVNGSDNPTSAAFATWYQDYQTKTSEDTFPIPVSYPLAWGCGANNCNSDVTDWTAGYAVQSINENALIWNITSQPLAIQAWAIALAQTYAGMVFASPTMTQKYTVYHEWDSMPLMPDGAYQVASHAVTESTAGVASVTCSLADSYLESSGTGTKTLTGCNGGYDVMVGGFSANNYIPGTTGSYMFARYNVTGVQTFTGNAGNHLMYGCGTCGSGGSDVFNFPAAANSGSDKIMNFSTVHDTLGVHSNGTTCTSAATVVANCMTTTGQDTTMTINGKTVLFKGIRDKSALTALISMI